MSDSRRDCLGRWRFRLRARSSNRLWRFGKATRRTRQRQSKLCIIEPGATRPRAVVNTTPPMMFTMPTTPNKSEAKPALSKPADSKPPEIASASVPDTLTSLKVNPETGLARAEVDVRRKQDGYNEVAEKKGHPVLKFLRKFWGISAWMLELIMVLSAVLGKYSDLVVVGALLVINAVLSFMQERRAAGVV